MINTLIALPYELARLPLTVVDKTLVGRMDETSGPRVTFDRAIGSVDKLAGEVLSNRNLAQRGAKRLERSAKLVTAVRLEQEADVRRAEAAQALESGRDEAARKRQQAKDMAASGLVEADAAEARAKQEAKTKATRSAAAKKAAANKRAATKTTTAKLSKANAARTAEAKKAAAQRSSKDDLKAARETKQSAAEARADAERLSDLADAKKQERKQD
jgi:hypothetical protein